eukprot:8032477-Pyramimonas_sp.AAC.1
MLATPLSLQVVAPIMLTIAAGGQAGFRVGGGSLRAVFTADDDGQRRSPFHSAPHSPPIPHNFIPSSF